MNKASLGLKPVAMTLALAVVFAWCLSATVLDLPFLASQSSRLLMKLGAADGSIVNTHEWWRIVSSQFLHVHFHHMLFNAACILVIGGFIEAARGARTIVSVFVVGGCMGQVASVLGYPDLVSSGASQALMALCGAALVIVSRPCPKLVVFAITAVQLALDLYVAGTLKVGHGVGFLAGLLMGVIIHWMRRTQVQTPAIS